jgi:hypothetical protein
VCDSRLGLGTNESDNVFVLEIGEYKTELGGIIKHIPGNSFMLLWQ